MARNLFYACKDFQLGGPTILDAQIVIPISPKRISKITNSTKPSKNPLMINLLLHTHICHLKPLKLMKNALYTAYHCVANNFCTISTKNRS